MRSSRPSTWWYSPGTLTPSRSATAFIVTRSRPISYAARAIIARSMPGRPADLGPVGEVRDRRPSCRVRRVRHALASIKRFDRSVLRIFRAESERTARAHFRTSFRRRYLKGARRSGKTRPCRAARRPRLRPVRRRHRRRPARRVAPAPRRSAALLQRAVRLLRAEPVRRRACRVARLADLQLGARHRARDDRHDARRRRRRASATASG